ncbi:hypothetical protein JAAARDRAFT_193815 [Jaapia argillacea MUCL 33604]|uniref:Hemerythrin-like domain-containing protein n=1 Tax=Jaapia argillacea MUCL 33604 TaxID=933084 RepID=A0A067Q4I5_9AGAM|nr:hypothetical protein JAAARDRAFT_193815 [Jaapia argillacea MUCL 33604]
MAHFHAWFKQEFNSVYEVSKSVPPIHLADGSFNARGMSLRQYLRQAKSLSTHLTFHHSLEERHIFPVLAEKMPQFDHAADGEHIKSHKGIHDGLDELDALILKWTENPSEYSPVEMRECLDGFREVLFRHLDEEVNDLKGENMKKYWTLEEMERIPM